MIARTLGTWRTRLPALAAAGVLCGAIATGGIDARAPENAGPYFEASAAAVESVSHRIGHFNGFDTRVSPGATDLLKPNALLQRTYEDGLTGHEFSLLIVHCRDARDMEGHYPPICYQNNGYEPVSEERVALEVPGLERTATAQATRYSYLTPTGLRQVEITNFLVVPAHQPPYVPDMAPVRRASRSRASAGLGSAQVQIIFDERMPSRSKRDEVIERVLGEIGPVLELIGRGPRNEQ